MTNQLRLNNDFLPTFGIEIAHSRAEASEVPPEQSARETLTELEAIGDHEQIAGIMASADEINKVVLITRESEDKTLGLLEFFTVSQLKDMVGRIHGYLGTDIETHLKELSVPPGYPFYVGRLASHFVSADSDVTSQFGAFESRHTDPTLNAIGPRERNSREYANWANVEILRQFEAFYQADFKVKLVGPTKVVEDGRVSWERGIAECQFLVLDYVRDQLATGHSTSNQAGEITTMTIDDIERNIINLLINRTMLLDQVATLNPILAEQLENNIESVAGFAIEVFHRGRMGTLRFRREPEAARRALRRVETLLVHASSLAQAREDQAEIPVLDL